MTERLGIRAGAVEWREVEGEIVALDVSRSEYLAINRTGTVLWRLLDAGTTREDLVAEIVRAFGVAEDAAERDVAAFLAALDERGLVER